MPISGHFIFMEKQINRETIYEGKVIRVVKDEVLIDDGSKAFREVVLHNGGACIALKDGDFYYMVRQYRYPLGKMMLEFPAGKIENQEDPKQTVLREAQEEVGYTVKNLKEFSYIVPTCGYCSEKIYLYYGEADKKVGQHLDDDENLKVEKYTFKQIKEMIKNNEIEDSKTIALVLHLEMAGIDA